MRIYFAGLGGVGIGPLALLARDAGHDIVGSDQEPSRYTELLKKQGVELSTDQTGRHLEKMQALKAIDWFVYTSAMPAEHPELQTAHQLAIPHISKRDELINHLAKENNLDLIAVSGTHGKTTVTAMLAWLFDQLKIASAHLVGTNLPFAPAGRYQPGAKFLIMEADEYDRTMLNFHSILSLIPSLDYDHPDTYPDPADYKAAFRQFVEQSQHTVLTERVARQLDLKPTDKLTVISATYPISLAGEHNRTNATLVSAAAEYFQLADKNQISAVLDRFPGAERRFEKLADNLYTDYAHHPAEIKATLQLAKEIADNRAIVTVYQPHQNIRQLDLLDKYGDCFAQADKVYWLPTYLTREDPALPIVEPMQLVSKLTGDNDVVVTQMDDSLAELIKKHLAAKDLVVVMGAGSVDEWLRSHFANH